VCLDKRTSGPIGRFSRESFQAKTTRNGSRLIVQLSALDPRYVEEPNLTVRRPMADQEPLPADPRQTMRTEPGCRTCPEVAVTTPEPQSSLPPEERAQYRLVNEPAMRKAFERRFIAGQQNRRSAKPGSIFRRAAPG
jgi:hypothetical protein